jgi:hypothetical protein
MSGAPESNPYQSPSYASSFPGPGGGGTEFVTERILEIMRQTQPWVRFLSVIGIILAAFMVVGGLSLALFVIPMGGMGSIGSFEMMVFGFYPLLGVLALFPALQLWRYASRIADFRATLQAAQLESALAAQKSFWKYVGVVMLVIIALYVLILATALVVDVRQGWVTY